MNAETGFSGGDKPFWTVFNACPFDTLKLLFSEIDIRVTVRRVEVRYVNSGRDRPRYPVRSMLLALLFMRFEAIPSVRKLCRRLEKRRCARMICEFSGDRTPKHNTFSLFINRAKPETIEDLFKEIMMENPCWRGIAKIRMRVAMYFTCMYAVAITAHKIIRPELANSIVTFTY